MGPPTATKHKRKVCWNCNRFEKVQSSFKGGNFPRVSHWRNGNFLDLLSKYQKNPFGKFLCVRQQQNKRRGFRRVGMAKWISKTAKTLLLFLFLQHLVRRHLWFHVIVSPVHSRRAHQTPQRALCQVRQASSGAPLLKNKGMSDCMPAPHTNSNKMQIIFPVSSWVIATTVCAAYLNLDPTMLTAVWNWESTW